MSKPIVLRTDAELNMGESVMSKLAEIAEIVTTEDDRPETTLRHVADAELIFTCYAPITAEIINAGTKLRGIVKYGVGTDSIDLDAASARGIPVSHCPTYGTDTVADQAFALLIGVARKLSTIDAAMKQEGWLWPESEYIGVDLAHKTIGLVGFGHIGKAMARRAGGFSMKRLVYDPYVPQTTEGWDGLAFVGLNELLEQSDFISMHCVLTPETRGIIGAGELQRMKDSAIVVNVSRGALIDEPSLIHALQEGQIAGAGLDVFVAEPLSTDHPLLQLDNVVLSPHLAFYTKEAHERLEQQCLRKISDVLQGRMPDDVKNREALKSAT